MGYPDLCQFVISHTKGPRSRVSRKGLGSLVLSMGPRSQVEGPGSRVPPMGPDSRALLFRYAPATLLKKRPWHRCFPVNFAKFLRTPVLQNTSGRLLLCFMVFSDWASKTFAIGKSNVVVSIIVYRSILWNFRETQVEQPKQFLHLKKPLTVKFLRLPVQFVLLNPCI